MELNAKQDLSQRQVLSYAQIQSLQVLSMNCDELERFVQQEIEDNPLLEPPEYTETTSILPTDFHPYSGEASYRDIPAPEHASLREHLLRQLNERTMNAQEWRCMQFLIDSLDDQGFLDLSAQEAAALLRITPALAKQCVARLQSLDPPGVGARDLGDCLYLQLVRLGQQNESYHTLLHTCLEDLAAGRFHKITLRTGISKLVQHRCLQAIRQLDPHPAAAFDYMETRFVTPDLICEYTNGHWSVQINDRWMGTVGISALYDRLLRADGRPEIQAYYTERLARAQLVLSSIEKRRATLTALVLHVVRHQSAYLLADDPLRPLSFRGLAEEMDISESTISRAVRDKYIQTPRKTILLRHLFTTALPAVKETSQAQALQVLQDLIASEDKRAPLSDQALMERLQHEGITLARRTVAKYRESLGIPGAAQRKR